MSKFVRIFFPNHEGLPLEIGPFDGKVVISGDESSWVRHYGPHGTQVVAVVPKEYLVIVFEREKCDSPTDETTENTGELTFCREGEYRSKIQ